MSKQVDKYGGDNVLDVMSKFAVNRNNYIEKLIRKNLGLNNLSEKKTLLEFGAGRGEFINRFANDPMLETIAVELDPDYVKNLSLKHKTYADFEKVPPVDFIYLIDVLEHLEHDEDFLKRFYAKLKPGGRLFIYVPARMELFTEFDNEIGHYRRYVYKDLRDKIKRAGFNLRVIRYHEIIGYFAQLANKLIVGKTDLNPKSLKIYDNILVPSSNFLERFIPVPIGKSLYAMAEKS